MCRSSTVADSVARRCAGPAAAVRAVALALVGVAMAALLAVAPARADDVGTWLEERGLTELLATHLEAELDAAKEPQRRQQVAARLAALYAALLEQAGDSAEASRLEERGRKLLASVQGLEADALRVALLGASQRAAARTLERWRLRLVPREEAEAARAALERLAPELRTLGASLSAGLATLQRKLSRASGIDSTTLGDEVERWQRLKSQATFLSAWTQYYIGWVDRRQDALREAEASFTELLDTGSAAPRPEDVSIDLRGLEPYARAVLGFALVRGLLQRPAAALPWLDLLEPPDAFEGIRGELPAWRLSVLLDGGEWEQAAALTAALAAEPSTPSAWLRLAAARALEDESGAKAATQLARDAVAALASRGEVAHVLDLARRYGAARLGHGDEGGFVLHYVRGVEHFDVARGLHGGEEPLVAGAGASKAIEAYGAAATEFRAAIAESDAPSFADAAAAAQALVGWSRWYAGRYADAAEAFERAAERQRPADGAESLWMAIVALDRLRDAPSGGRAAAERADRLAAKLVEAHPSSPRVPYLLLRQARSGEPATPERVEKLLAIPPASEAYAAARRAAVQSLYELYRNAKGPARTEAAQRFLAVAAPWFEEEESRLPNLPEKERLGFVVRARQLLDAAMGPGVERHELAATALDRLEARGREGLIDLSSLSMELGFRRMETQLHAGDLAAAERTARELIAAGAEPTWRDAIARAMFRDAVERWRAGAPGGGLDDPLALGAVVEWGGRVLAEPEAIADAPLRRAALQESALLATLATVVEASARLFAINGDEVLGSEAMGRMDALLALRPNDAAALRWDALVSEGMRDDARALARLRTILAGAGVGSEPWYEAKWRLISILRRSDPPRAREVMDQHTALQPDYGPPPWGERLRELDSRIPKAPPAPPAPAASGASTPAGGPA